MDKHVACGDLDIFRTSYTTRHISCKYAWLAFQANAEGAFMPQWLWLEPEAYEIYSRHNYTNTPAVIF